LGFELGFVDREEKRLQLGFALNVSRLLNQSNAFGGIATVLTVEFGRLA
jgi:hypothetical protein